MLPIGIIALIAFWGAVIKVWIWDGPKVPLIFIALWVFGFFAFPRLGLSSYFFIAFEAILAGVLLLIERAHKTFQYFRLPWKRLKNACTMSCSG